MTIEGLTNEELTVRIKQGERELLPVLWEQVEAFVRFKARRRLPRIPNNQAGIIELDDLVNSAYLELEKAVAYYDESRGVKFLTIYDYFIRSAFAEAFGFKRNGQPPDPLLHARSFEEQVGDNEETTLEGTIVDPAAEKAFDEVNRRMFLEQLREALSVAFRHLSRRQKRFLKQHFYMGMTLQAIAEKHGTSKQSVSHTIKAAFLVLRRPGYKLWLFTTHDTEQQIHEKTNYFARVGVERFSRTGASAVEETVFRRESWRKTEVERETDKIINEFDKEVKKALKERPWLKEKLQAIQSSIQDTGDMEWLLAGVRKR